MSFLFFKEIESGRGGELENVFGFEGVVFMVVILAMAVLLSMPRPNCVVAFTPYLSANGALHYSTVTSLRVIIMPAMCVLMA